MGQVPAQRVAHYLQRGTRRFYIASRHADISAVAKDTTAGADVALQMRAVEDFIAFLKKRINERRAEPTEDAISSIVTFEAEGRKFTEEECLGLLWSIAGAATDTTRHSIGHTPFYVHETPDQRQRIIADPTLIPAVLEESLRLEAPAFTIARIAVSDVTVGAARLKPGDRVLLVYGSGNRDETVFENPDEFIVGWPNVLQHCTFGKGVQICLGMHLTRLEVRLVLQQVPRGCPITS